MPDLALVPESTALLCLDLQRDIIAESPLAPSEPEARARFERCVERCQQALAWARANEVEVMHVRVAFRPGYPEANPHSPMFGFMRQHGVLVEGRPGTEFDARVRPAAGEIVITKRGVSAFVGTELERLLSVKGITSVLLAGLVTHYVVEGTARHAADLGLRFVVLGDCCTSGGLERHEAALVNLRPLGTVADLAAVQRALASGAVR